MPTKEKILVIAEKVKRKLTPANARNLVEILALMDNEGRVGLADVLKKLYSGKTRDASQVALRKFRAVITDGAVDAGVVFSLDSDGQTRTEPQDRHLTFKIGEPDAPRLQEIVQRSTRAEVADIEKVLVRPEGIPLNENRPLIRYFVVWAQADVRLKGRLLKKLQTRLAGHTRARMELWSEIEVGDGGGRRESAHDEMRACTFGLVFMSPSLAASGAVDALEVAELRREKPVVLVPLVPIVAAAAPEGKAFSQARQGREQDEFADLLFKQIDECLEKPKPVVERLRDPALRAAREGLLLERFVPNPGTPLRAMEKHALESIQSNPGYREEALDYLLRWLQDSKASPWCALLAEYGMGKTTTCKAFASDLIRRRDAGEQLPLPIYLDLRSVGQSARTGLALEQILNIVLGQSWKAGPGGDLASAQDVLEVVRTQGALIIWDGLDEVLVHLDQHAGQQFTRQLYSILPQQQAAASPLRSRLLISCRTHFFRTLREQQTHFLAEGRDNIRGEQFSGFMLLPFGGKQIRQYIAQTLHDHDIDRVMQTIGAVHNLRELAERPYTLSLIASEFAGIERWKAEGKRVTGVTLYRHMVLSWLERDTGKHHFTPDHKQALMEHVAAELWRSGARFWSIRELEQWLVDFLRARPELAAHYPDKTPELLKEDLRTATFLVRDDREGGNDQFRFAHTSLQEYFLAGYLRQALLDGKPELWDLPRPSEETVDFLGQWLLEANAPAAMATLGRLRDQYRPRASELAFAYFLLAKRKGYPSPSAAGFQLAGAKLVGWELRGTEGSPLVLSRANFRGAQLWNSQWRYCNLDGADFSGANADRAEFLNCYLTKSVWREAFLTATLFRDCRLSAAEMDGSFRNRTRFIRSHVPEGDATSRLGLSATGGHAASVFGCAWSPDGSRIVSASHDNTLRVWDAASGDGLMTLFGHSDSVRGCAWSPDSSRIVSASDDKTLRVWDAASGNGLLTLSASVRGCAWSADGSRIVSASDDNTLRIWDAATGECFFTLSRHWGSVFGCAWSPAGSRIVSASADHTLRVWDAATGECFFTLSGHSGSVIGCAWSPDGSRIVSASADKTLRVWDAATGDGLLALSGHSDSVWGCAWSPDGSRIVSASDDKTLRVWDAATGDGLFTLSGHSDSVWGCAWSPDGSRIVSASHDHALRIWDSVSGDSLVRLSDRSAFVRGCAWSPDGSRIVSASNDNTRVWDAATGDCLFTLSGHSAFVCACAWSPDSSRIASASADKTLRVWDAAHGDNLLSLSGHSKIVRGCAWSPDGSRIVSASDDKTLRVWDVASGDNLLTLSGHSKSVSGCVWSPDGSRIVSASDDRTLRVWDAATGDGLFTFSGHSRSVRACAWSPDGSRIVSASSDTLRVWYAASGDCRIALYGHSRGVNACAWSPDTSRIVSASDDHTLRVWDAESGDCLLILSSHEAPVTGCDWSPDGSRIVSSSYDGALRVWDATSGRPLAAFHTFRHPRAEGTDWAALDLENNRILACSPEAWRSLRWVSATESFPAEIYGPLPVKPYR